MPISQVDKVLNTVIEQGDQAEQRFVSLIGEIGLTQAVAQLNGYLVQTHARDIALTLRGTRAPDQAPDQDTVVKWLYELNLLMRGGSTNEARAAGVLFESLKDFAD